MNHTQVMLATKYQKEDIYIYIYPQEKQKIINELRLI